jgi:flagellar protein FliS
MNPYGAHQTYLETSVSSADPLELVRLLYRSAIEALRKARAAHAQVDVRERNRQASRAQAILAELATSLDAQVAPELSARLAQLYEYAAHLTQQGIFEQREEPLEQSQRLLETLLEGWEQCHAEAPRVEVNAA